LQARIEGENDLERRLYQTKELAVYAMRELTGESEKEIGRIVGESEDFLGEARRDLLRNLGQRTLAEFMEGTKKDLSYFKK